MNLLFSYVYMSTIGLESDPIGKLFIIVVVPLANCLIKSNSLLPDIVTTEDWLVGRVTDCFLTIVKCKNIKGI